MEYENALRILHVIKGECYEALPSLAEKDEKLYVVCKMISDLAHVLEYYMKLKGGPVDN